MKTFLVILAISLFPITSCGESTCRCGKNLISIGDSKIEVKAKCGETDLVDYAEVEVYADPQKRG
ncbi:MAG: DUF2845 domain-containing protein [Candidatus Hydrogenedentota bacterium]|nr:MAG: DUF2845 domain-containing protein [Candidatus Hydrogenedentota bacterium]